MADVQTGGDSGGGRHKKKRAKKSGTHIDMTPMVDLAFLLLTFFILTTTMYKPATLQLTFPVPNKDDVKPPKVENAITLFLTKKDQILYYRGGFELGITQLERTDFKQLTNVLTMNNKTAIEQIQGYQKDLMARKITETAFDSLKNEVQKQKFALFAIIKPDKDAKYRNMIDIVDEMDIHGIGKYAVQDSIKPEEQALLDIAKQTL
ncbi:MAG: biopolymer transporter ExbD [Flavobacteriales bacterium]